MAARGISRAISIDGALQANAAEAFAPRANMAVGCGSGTALIAIAGRYPAIDAGIGQSDAALQPPLPPLPVETLVLAWDVDDALDAPPVGVPPPIVPPPGDEPPGDDPPKDDPPIPDPPALDELVALFPFESPEHPIAAIATLTAPATLQKDEFIVLLGARSAGFGDERPASR